MSGAVNDQQMRGYSAGGGELELMAVGNFCKNNIKLISEIHFYYEYDCPVAAPKFIFTLRRQYSTAELSPQMLKGRRGGVYDQIGVMDDGWGTREEWPG